MSLKENRALKLKANSYVLISGILFRRNFDGILLRCLIPEKAKENLRDMYGGYVEGIFPCRSQPTKSLEHDIIVRPFSKTPTP